MRFLLFCVCVFVQHVTSNPVTELENVSNNHSEMEALKNQWSHLSIELKMMILEKLDLVDLVEMAGTNQDLSYFASYVFRQRFGERMIVLTTESSSSPHQPKYTFDHKGNLRIQNFPLALNMLKNLGHMFTRLTIEYIKSDEPSQLDEYVNAYCSESLLELFLVNSVPGTFEQCKKPYVNVERVFMRGDLRFLPNSNVKLSEIFPSVRHLTLGALNFPNGQWLDHTMPKLEHIFIYIWSTEAREGVIDEPLAASLLEKNPQLKSVELYNPTENLLHVTANVLPHLEKLNIRNYHEVQSNQLHFDHVTEFSITDQRLCGISMPSNIRFEKIDQLIVDGEPKECTKWIDFIGNNQQLRNITVERYVGNDELIKLNEIIVNLNVEILSMGFLEEVTPDALAQLIERGTKLKQVNLRLMLDRELYQPFDAFLNERLGQQWNITRDLFKVFLLKK